MYYVCLQSSGAIGWCYVSWRWLLLLVKAAAFLQILNCKECGVQTQVRLHDEYHHICIHRPARELELSPGARRHREQHCEQLQWRRRQQHVGMPHTCNQLL